MRNTTPQRELVERTGLRLVRMLAMMVATLAVTTTGCGLIPITEPPTLPGAVRNFLDEPVDVYGYSVDEPDVITLLVCLEPGDVYELDTLNTRCRDEGLVALAGEVEVGRLEDRCSIDTEHVWVLHPEGDYITRYDGNSTYYPRD